MSDTDQDWNKWGEQDPYFGVITDAQFSRENIETNRAIFYQTGEEQVAMFLAQAEDAIGEITKGRALDFGCGTGRLAIPLAMRFESVLGLDVAPGMLREAQAEAARRSLLNTSFLLSDDNLSVVSGNFDFVHSYIVLQHIPTERGFSFINRMLEMTAPNGVAMIQAVARRPQSLRYGFRYFLHHSVPGVRQLHNLGIGKPASAPTMQMNEYDPTRIFQIFAAKNFGPVLSYLEMNSGILSVRYVARRAKGSYMAQFESPDFGVGCRYSVSDSVRRSLGG